MKVLIEVHHPAHIHFWKYPIRELQARGHQVRMIARDRDVMRRLAEAYDWLDVVTPKRYMQANSFPLIEMLHRQWVVAREIYRFKPDVVASLMGSYTQSAKLFGVRNVIFTDSEFQHFNHKIAHPFADEIYTPECFYKDLGHKQRRYSAIHEWSFLSPKYFEAQASVLSKYPSLVAEQYVVIRLSAWNTFHDRGESGIGEQIYKFVERFKERYTLVLSAEERRLPPGLEHLELQVAPEDYHQVLSQAAFVLSEGASTASEAVCVGVPTVYINSTETRGYLLYLAEVSPLLKNFQGAAEGMLVAEEYLAHLSETPHPCNGAVPFELDLVEYVVDALEGTR